MAKTVHDHSSLATMNARMPSLRSISLCLFVLLALFSSSSAEGDMRLQILSRRNVQRYGAACLDGSAPGYYVNLTKSTRWIISFQGGGWCYNEIMCLSRSKGGLGTSTGLPTSMSAQGVLDADPSNNPIFYNANRVFLHYCDGASFAGYVEQPVKVDGEEIMFRGLGNLQGIIQELKDQYNFNAATEVFLTGGSAGGLATFLHADYVKTLLPPSVTKYGVAPASGLFIDHPNVFGTPLHYVFNMQNATHGVNQKCIEAGLGSSCMLAQYAYDHIESPIFVMNSGIDSWSLQCILTAMPTEASSTSAHCAAAQGYQDCGKKYESCTSDQTQKLINFDISFREILTRSPTFAKKGNGAFIHTCVTHVASWNNNLWNNIEVNGLSFKDAFTAWWNSDFNKPASMHSTLPECELKTGSPHRCNPTCPA